LIDQQSLREELVSKLLYCVEISCPINSLASLEIKFHGELWLGLLQLKDDLVHNFEDLELINLD
jgi:hypothetical protein